MISRQDDEEAGPSGLAHHEILTLLGLEMSEEEETPANSSDLLCPEEMACRDEDEVCNDVLDRFERQHAFQTNLLEQSGGGMDAGAEGA